MLVPTVVPPPTFANVWAVLIGVDDYNDPGIPDLEFAGRDARAMLGALENAYIGATTRSAALSPIEDSAGIAPTETRAPGSTTAVISDSNDILKYDRTHALVLARGGDGAPTAANVRYALQTWLPARAKRGDLALVFLSGHGIPLKDDSSPDGVKRYFITSDVNANKIASTALGMDEIAKYVACLPSEHVVTFIDSCFSGSPDGKGLAGSVARGDRFWRSLSSATGKMVITACAFNEQSVEVSSLESGLFTYYVAEGLTGFADDNRDGILSIAELYQYIRIHVRAHASRLGVRQSPQAAAVSQSIYDYALLTTREYDDKKSARDEAEAKPFDDLTGINGHASSGARPGTSAIPPPPPLPSPFAANTVYGTLNIALDYDLSYARIESLTSSFVSNLTGEEETETESTSLDYGANPLPLTMPLPAGDYRITIGALGRLEKLLAITIRSNETVTIENTTLEIDSDYAPSAPDNDLADKLDITDLFTSRER